VRDVPNMGIILREVNEFGSLWGYKNITNEAIALILNLARTIPCHKVELLHVCFDPGPPPQQDTLIVGLGEIILPPEYVCYISDLDGTKDCPPCDNNFYWIPAPSR